MAQKNYTLSATFSLLATFVLLLRQPLGGLPNEFVDSQRLDSVCRERFFKALAGYPQKRLEYLCLMTYVLSYVL